MTARVSHTTQVVTSCFQAERGKHKGVWSVEVECSSKEEVSGNKRKEFLYQLLFVTADSTC
jgi:hypothetical protein